MASLRRQRLPEPHLPHVITYNLSFRISSTENSLARGVYLTARDGRDRAAFKAADSTKEAHVIHEVFPM